MHRIIFTLAIVILLTSCKSEENNSNKNKHGAFTCTISAVHKSQSNCQGESLKNPAPASYGELNISSLEGSDASLNGAIFLINKTSGCGENEDFFPVAIAQIKSEKSTGFVLIGMPCNPIYNPKEITDFFEFQLAHSRTMKSITEWIELEYHQEWLVTSWMGDKKAKAYLDRLGIKS
jgi:hypothetical protein